MEIWQKINDGYEVSNFGNIKSLKHNKTLKPEKTSKGYLRVNVYENKIRYRKLVHILVADAFLSKNDFKCMPDEDRTKVDLSRLQVNHKNEIKDDNRVENLEFCTLKYNINYGNGKWLSAKIRGQQAKGRWNKLSEEEQKEKTKHLKDYGFKKGNIPWNKGKKGLYTHNAEWKRQASIRQKELNRNKMIPVICIETGEIFESQSEASKTKKISQGNIQMCLKGKRNIAGGFHWKYK